MTFDKWELKDFLTIDQAVDYLSVKGGQSQDLINPNRVRGVDVLRLALDGRLPLVVDVPTGTEDSEGRSIEAGLWDLPIEQAAKQQIEYDWRLRDGSDSRNTDGIEGAWVERGKDRRQLEPVRDFGSSSAFGLGCILGVRKEALDALLSQETASNTVIEAEWRDVTITFLSEHNMQMKVGETMLMTTSYEELGFEDRKRDRPIKAWETFRQLAEAEPTRLELPSRKQKTRLMKDGTTREAWKDETGDTERVAIENRIKEINQKLREALDRRGYMIPNKPPPIVLNKEHGCYEPTPGFRMMVSSGYRE
jgi:hypothetical protein